MSADATNDRPILMHPDLRLTVRRDGLVRAVPWNPGLITFGPSATLLDARGAAGITIADAEIVRDEADEDGLEDTGRVTELVIDVLAGGNEAALDAIVDWAGLVGYERVWLPTGLFEIDGAPPEPRVETRCTGCRARLSDGGRAFWCWVRGTGHFPTMCHLCGADLPQWRPVRRGVRTPVELVARQASGEIVELPVSDRRAG